MSRQTMLLGVLGMVAVVALWWIFLYSPGQDELALVEADIAAAQDEAIALRSRVGMLEAVRAAAPETEAAIATLRSFVPADPALPGALRQLASAAADAGVEITSLATSRPTVVDEPTGLHAITVAANVEGSYFQVVDLLRRLESPAITARGIEFSSVVLATSEYPALTVTLTGAMYAELEPVPDPVAEANVPAEQPDAADGEEPPADGGTDGEDA